MSSEGSVSTSSSGIRQFGLYRTIDSRTEEFLRLSRKRQIKQGCACAAISTAVTVAIVISILLIYEYSIFYEPNSKIVLKSNWLSLMNTSLESLPFEAKVNKARIQLDPTYIKFLPLILKTIKKNRFLDKIIEEDSSQNPLSERRETKDGTHTTNVFSDSRTWMRIPTSRLYTIEYKTSPIIYYNNPTRNIDYITKIRQIRDNQRIINYFDKMINEKVTLGYTVPMFRNSRIYKEPQPAIYTTPMTKTESYETNKPISRKKVQETQKVTHTKIEKSHCRCPKGMSILLSKLIRSLQKLTTDLTKEDVQNPKPCNNRILATTTEQVETIKNQFKLIQYKTGIKPPGSISKNIISHFSKTGIDNPNSPFQNNYKIVKTTEKDYYYTPNIRSISTANNDYDEPSNIESKSSYMSKPFNPKVDYTLSSIIRLLEPNWLPYKKNAKYSDDITTTTTNQYIEGTDAEYILQESTTKPMSTLTTTTKKSLNTSPVVTDFVLQKNKTIDTFSTLPSSDNGDEYEDYMDITTNPTNDSKILDGHSIELLKQKIFTPTYTLPNNTINYDKIQTDQENFKKLIQHEPQQESEKNNNNKTWNLLNQMGKIVSSTATPKLNIISHINTTEIVTENLLDVTDMEFTTSKQNYVNKNKLELQPKSEDITLEEEIDKTFPEETASEDSFKSLEYLLNKLNDSEIFNKTLEGESAEMYEWELIKIDDEDNKTKSMIPESRSSYLEIHRGDWKQDEPQEYDNNNYLFE